MELNSKYYLVCSFHCVSRHSISVDLFDPNTSFNRTENFFGPHILNDENNGLMKSAIGIDKSILLIGKSSTKSIFYKYDIKKNKLTEIINDFTSSQINSRSLKIRYLKDLNKFFIASSENSPLLYFGYLNEDYEIINISEKENKNIVKCNLNGCNYISSFSILYNQILNIANFLIEHTNLNTYLVYGKLNDLTWSYSYIEIN